MNRYGEANKSYKLIILQLVVYFVHNFQ